MAKPTQEQMLDHVLGLIRHYAKEHCLSAEQVRRFFDAGISANSALNDPRENIIFVPLSPQETVHQ
jgi:hypothetical protein